jgi:hypothetical protein
MADLGPDERELLAVLRDALDQTDPVPPALVDAARASFTWLTVDAELAELTADSVVDGAAVRSTRSPRLLTFTARETTLVVEVAEPTAGKATERRLIGQIVGPRAAEVDVRHTGGSLTVTADEYGRFRAEPVPAGPISLACRFADTAQPQVVTSWVTV